MILVDPILEIIKTCHATTYLRSDRPINLLLLAEPDSGKSEMLLAYKTSDTEVMSDVTSRGLFDTLKAHNEKRPLVLVLPDFNAVVSHKSSVTGPTIAALLSLLQEGTMKIADAGGTRDLKGRKLSVITAMTPGMALARAGKWRRSGFLRRFLPIYYRYSDETTRRIHADIQAGHYKEDIQAAQLRLPNEKTFITLLKPLASQVNEFCNMIKDRVEHHGFTLHKHFRSYVKARALLRRSRVCSEKDFEDLKKMAEYVRLDKPCEI